MSSWSHQRANVRRLAAAADLAARRERAFRAGLIESGRRLLTGGKVVVVMGLAGMVVLALRRRRHDDHEGRGEDDHSPSLIARAGMFLLAIFRWRTLASDVLKLFEPPPEVREPDGSVSES